MVALKLMLTGPDLSHVMYIHLKHHQHCNLFCYPQSKGWCGAEVNWNALFWSPPHSTDSQRKQRGLKGMSITRTGCPGKCHHPQRNLKDMQKWHSGTWFVVDLAVLGLPLDLMIVDVSSNLNDSMTLWPTPTPWVSDSCQVAWAESGPEWFQLGT